MKVVSPYRKIKQYTRISVEPYHMNSDIRNNMKNILKKKTEKKCNKNGFIDEVYRIVEHSDGIMPPENLSGSAIFNITYECRICVPVENTFIIAHVKVINQELIVAINGPIMIFVPKENVDNNIWDIPENYLNKNTKTKLMVGNYVKIQIVDKRINQNDTKINAIGKLHNFATDEEVENFYHNKSDEEINQSIESTEQQITETEKQTSETEKQVTESSENAQTKQKKKAPVKKSSKKTQKGGNNEGSNFIM